MLILTRKSGQRIQIGPDILVIVWPDGKGRVRVGIQAPAHVAIRRTELDSGIDGDDEWDDEELERDMDHLYDKPDQPTQR